MMRSTMSDVARRAGVSKSTVSLVLNGKPNISSEVRDAVRDAAQALDYRLPERYAAALPSEAKTITIIHFDAVQFQFQVGPGVAGLHLYFLQGIEDVLHSSHVNWSLIANYREGNEHEIAYQMLKGKKLPGDGLILMGIPSRHSWVLQKAINDNIPVVALGRDWPELPINTVSQNHYEQTRIALDYLAELGHRKIAFLAREGDRDIHWFKLRFASYRDSLEKMGAVVEKDLIVVEADVKQATRDLMIRRPDVTAIFCINDEPAVDVLHALQEMGRHVPDDVSVIGLDNSVKYFSADLLAGAPPLTTVDYPHYQTGRLAAELLLRHIGDDQIAYSKIYLRSRLVERASCGEVRRS